jgi:hypothetical protein
MCRKHRKRIIFDEIRATNRNKKISIKIGIKMRKSLNDNSIKAKKGLGWHLPPPNVSLNTASMVWLKANTEA